MKAKRGENNMFMICCGDTICPEVSREGAMAFATWTCYLCGTKMHQVIGAINAEDAKRTKSPTRR